MSRQTCDQCKGQTYCRRCRPEEFQREVDARLVEFRTTGFMRWTDPTRGTQILNVRACIDAARRSLASVATRDRGEILDAGQAAHGSARMPSR